MGPRFTPWEAAIPTDSGSVFRSFTVRTSYQTPLVVQEGGLAGALGVETKRMNSEVWSWQTPLNDAQTL
jgi:hypothetical protein